MTSDERYKPGCSAGAPETIARLMELLAGPGGMRLACTIGPGAAGPGSLRVELTGADTPLLTAHQGELLHAIEHVAAKAIRLSAEEHDRLIFEAEGFKANRERELRDAAAEAVARVRSTGRSFAFKPMTSRERRMLHLELAGSGLVSGSENEGARRFVVLYPTAAEAPRRAAAGG